VAENKSSSLPSSRLTHVCSDWLQAQNSGLINAEVGGFESTAAHHCFELDVSNQSSFQQ